MLPAPHRLRRSDEFELAVRRGVRVGRSYVVIHMTRASGQEPARAGLVVSKAVGNSVKRSLVKRRLREILRPTLAQLPGGTLVVARALPGSASAAWDELRAQTLSAMRQAESKLNARIERNLSPGVDAV